MEYGPLYRNMMHWLKLLFHDCDSTSQVSQDIHMESDDKSICYIQTVLSGIL